MAKLIDTFPSLAAQLSRALQIAGRRELALQLDNAVISEVTFDDDANAGYICVHPQQQLNEVEANIVGVRHGQTIEVKTKYWTNLDVDNFGRLKGVEILDPDELKEDLRGYARRA